MVKSELQSEKNLTKRIAEVNGIADAAYDKMMQMADSDDDGAEDIYETQAARYDRFIKLLVLLTKSYDDAVSMDKASGVRKAPRRKKTTLETLRGKQ